MVQPDLYRISFSTQALLCVPRRMSMDGLLRLVAGFHPVSRSRVGSDICEQAAPLFRDGDCPRQQVWDPHEFPNERKELGKRKQPWSSRYQLGRCSKPLCAQGLAAQPQCCGPALWQGRTLAIEPCPRSFAPAKLTALAITAIRRCPLGVSGWVKVGGLFPSCDGRGFANSCWRHRFPARHSVSRDLRLRPQSCLIR